MSSPGQGRLRFRLRFGGIAVWITFGMLCARAQDFADATRLVGAGDFKQAEAAVRQFLTTHQQSAEAHKLLGYVLFKENEPKQSLDEYLSAGRYSPLGAPEFEVMGCDYFLLEDYAAADEWLTRSINSGNKNALAFYLLGRTKYNEKHFEQAASFLEQSVSLDPKDVKAQTNLGRAYEQLGENEKAVGAYRGAVALASSDAGPYSALGTLLLKLNRASEALPYLSKAAQLAPEGADTHRELGKAYLALNQPKSARAELERAIELDPESAPTHFLLAETYLKLGLRQLAGTEQQRYRELSSSHSSPDDPLSEARALVQSGQLQQAEPVIRHYLDLHKNSADGHYLLGYILFKERDAKASLAEYTEGAKYRRPSARDLEAVAGDYVLLHDYEDADKWFTRSVEWDPGNWQALYYLGRTKYNENRFGEAVSIFQRCLQADPKSVKAEDNLGLALEGSGHKEEAIAAYRKAILLESDAAQKDAGPYLDLGNILLTGNRDSEAVPYLLQAVAIAPQDVRIHRALGKAYLHLNQLDQAKGQLEKSVELAPDDAPTHFILLQVYRRLGLHDKERVEVQRLTALNGAHSVQ